MSETATMNATVFGAAAMTIAATTRVMSDAAHAQSRTTTAQMRPRWGRHAHLVWPSQADRSGLLHVGYRKPAPPDLHWICCTVGPTTSTVMVRCPCVGSGGIQGRCPVSARYGTTRFLSSDTFRMASHRGSLSISSLDDALNIENAVQAARQFVSRLDRRGEGDTGSMSGTTRCATASSGTAPPCKRHDAGHDQIDASRAGADEAPRMFFSTCWIAANGHLLSPTFCQGDLGQQGPISRLAGRLRTRHPPITTSRACSNCGRAFVGTYWLAAVLQPTDRTVYRR